MSETDGLVELRDGSGALVAKYDPAQDRLQICRGQSLWWIDLPALRARIYLHGRAILRQERQKA